MKKLYWCAFLAALLLTLGIAMWELPPLLAVQAETGSQSSDAFWQEREDKINLNTACAAELVCLDGIGSGRAAAIIAYREEHGPFQSIEEVARVRGISNGIMEQIREDICVS